MGTFISHSPHMKLQAMFFAFPNGISQRTFLDHTGAEPRLRILLDNAILLEGVSVSETSIRVKVNTHYALEYMMSGSHQIALIAGRKRATTLIKVGVPLTPPPPLSPVIQRVDVIMKNTNSN